VTPTEEATEFLRLVDQLGEGERKVLRVLARRLLTGQARYGKLRLDTDTRQWRRERAEELLDTCIYDAIEEVARCLA
jgi:hypothetical protein